MLKNIQKYDILHSIIDDCRQKILKLAERPQGDMNMFKKSRTWISVCRTGIWCDGIM